MSIEKTKKSFSSETTLGINIIKEIPVQGSVKPRSWKPEKYVDQDDEATYNTQVSALLEELVYINLAFNQGTTLELNYRSQWADLRNRMIETFPGHKIRPYVTLQNTESGQCFTPWIEDDTA